MSTDFDIIIVGSGPAGVSAAFPLVEAGLRVALVDGGRRPAIQLPTLPYLESRTKERNQWRWMVGEKYEALNQLAAMSPKLRTPTLGYVFEDFQKINRIVSRDFTAIGSLATGGLSNAWGCGVAKLSRAEMENFPFPSEMLEISYERVARRIGISGCQADDLSDYFGLDAWAQPPIPMDALHTALLRRYQRQRPHLASRGFRLGRSRVAVLSEDRPSRKACDRSANCLWGCHRGALYSAADELPTLKGASSFHHIPGFLVEGLIQNHQGWSIVGQHEGQKHSLTATRVLLAAGTLATTRLALRVLRLSQPVPLLSCPMAVFLLWLPRMLGAPREAAFGLGQLSYALTLEDKVSGFGSTFGTTGLPISEFIQHLPLSRGPGLDLLRNLLSSCLAGNLFLPGFLSTSRAALDTDDSLRIDGSYEEQVPALMALAEAQLRRAFGRLGALLLPMSFTLGQPGGDIHYSGSLPMRHAPKPGETNAYGELHGLEGLHVIDGACLSTLSEKSHTLTIMANADRIGRQIAGL